MNTRDATLSAPMPDVQGSPDLRELPIQRVGVRSVRHPMAWRTEGGVAMPSVGTWSLYVALPATQKGTHMSRFLALLDEQAEAPLDGPGLRAMLSAMLERLEAQEGRIELEFPLFVRKTAPVSGVQSLMDYRVGCVAERVAGVSSLSLTVLVPVTSLCPCSRDISDYGAHNQRSHVTVRVTSRQEIAPEEIVRLVEAQASCELWGLLKRVDEKYVTERAYDNPKFVEDLVRDVAGAVKRDARVDSFTVEAENFESIHNHSAYARIDG